MDTMATASPSTEELLKRAEENGYELIDGQLVEKPMGAESSHISISLSGFLQPFVRSNRLGWVFGSECGYLINPADPKKVRKPDLSFIARGRLPEGRPPRGHVSIAPDLAVEVISPNDEVEDLDVRVQDYLQAGVKLLWLLFPKTACVWVVRADGSAARLRPNQELSGEEVVPGFSCKIADIFAD